MLLHNEKLVVLGRACELDILALPFIEIPVRAGFPSPADDYLETDLKLTEHLIQHPSATYYIRAAGESMINYGIFDGDLLIVDRSMEPKPGNVVVVAVDGELTCKKLSIIKGEHYLISGNSDFPPIALNGKDVYVWGVVTHNIHYLE